MMLNIIKRKFNRALSLTHDILDKCYNTLSFLFTKKENKILINSWIRLSPNGLKINNWGDDINYWLLKELTDKKIYNLSDMFLKCLPKDQVNILAIGSIIEYLGNNNSLIWGSGAQNGPETLDFQPRKVLAVRGPKTRDKLLSKGISCPEVYGDPSMLLAKIYRPPTKKKYHIGIIPHYIDKDNPLIKSFVGSRDDIAVIRMDDYDDWHDIPDRITECEIILSSSLHGLIISDTYNVPNVWISLSDKIKGASFKYLDYFASVGRNQQAPVDVKMPDDFQVAINAASLWESASLDLKPLIDCCPFKLKIASYGL